MTELFYRPAPGEPEIVAGSLLLVPHQWETFPAHRVTIDLPPDAGVAWGSDGNGLRVKVRILAPR